MEGYVGQKAEGKRAQQKTDRPMDGWMCNTISLPNGGTKKRDETTKKVFLFFLLYIFFLL